MRSMNNLGKFIKNNFWLIFSVVYILSPIDFIPEFLLPIVGPFIIVDDATVLIFSLYRRYRRYIDQVNESEQKKIPDSNLSKQDSDT